MEDHLETEQIQPHQLTDGPDDLLSLESEVSKTPAKDKRKRHFIDNDNHLSRSLRKSHSTSKLAVPRLDLSTIS